MKVSLGFFCIGALLCVNLMADVVTPDPVPASPVGETASYELAKSRSSWLIKRGQGTATVQEFVNDETLGPSYLVKIDYEFDIRFHGKEKGEVGLLVPEAMLADGFYENLATNHPQDLGGFSIDYEGTTNEEDGAGNEYTECTAVRLFDIDTSHYVPANPPESPRVAVLWHIRESGDSEIENLEIKLKIHPTVPVIGGVVIDVSGTARGFDIEAGFDYVPAEAP